MAWARTAVLLLAGVACVAGLYEDQAGTYDWYKPYVGHVTTAAFHKAKPRVYLATEQGVVVALNLRDGSIAFRHNLGDGKAATSQLLEAPAVFVSSVDNAVQAWDNADGVLKWSAPLPAANAGPYAPVIAVAPGSNPTVGVLGFGSLSTYDAATGEKQASIGLGEDAAKAARGFLHTSGPVAFTAYSYTPGESALHVTTMEGGVTLESPSALSGNAAVGNAGFLALSEDLTSVCIAGPWENTALHCVALATLGPVRGTATMQVVATGFGWALASGDPAKPGVVLLQLTESGGLTTAAKFESASAVSAPFAAVAGELVAVVETMADGAVKLSYVLTSSGSVASSEGPIKGARSERLAPGVTPPGVRAAVVGGYKKRDQSEGFRVLLVWQDERISLVQQGVTVWSRDEALGGVTKALFSDLPPGAAVAAGAAAAVGGSVAGQGWKEKLVQFAKVQLLSVKVQFKVATGEEVSELNHLRTEMSDKQLPTRDARGFRRAVVVATSSGKIAALHNGDGHVIWSRPGPAGRKGASVAPEHLIPWRTYHDLQHAPQVAVMSAGQDGSTTQLSVLDVYTGKEMQATQLPYTIDKLVSLGHIADGDHAEQQLYLAVHVPQGEGAKPKAYLLPDTPLARAHFASKHRSIFFFLDSHSGSPASQAFTGYGFDAAAAAEAVAGGVATAEPAWGLALPDPVLAWAAADPTEPLHTSVKVLGDRSMKYRYLNPNTMVVVTGAAVGSGSAPDEAMDTVATIYVVDTVTGAVRHSQTAPSCRGPAVVLMSENLVLVQLWDASAARFSVTSMELYDASERTFSVLDHMFNPNATAPQSSFAPPPLEVPSAAFFTRTPAKALLSTRTRAGITSKLLIGLTHTDQIYTLDMRFVDPRRPQGGKLTAEQQEERLIPYADTLPLMPPLFASYNKQVLGLKASISAPSRLESTSLLFSYGLDLQYTRLAPAKGFDSLDDDFSYGLLVVALLVLSGASVFMHIFTKKSMLKAKWQ